MPNDFEGWDDPDYINDGIPFTMERLPKLDGTMYDKLRRIRLVLPELLYMVNADLQPLPIMLLVQEYTYLYVHMDEAIDLVGTYYIDTAKLLGGGTQDITYTISGDSNVSIDENTGAINAEIHLADDGTTKTLLVTGTLTDGRSVSKTIRIEVKGKFDVIVDVVTINVVPPADVNDYFDVEFNDTDHRIFGANSTDERFVRASVEDPNAILSDYGLINEVVATLLEGIDPLETDINNITDYIANANITEVTHLNYSVPLTITPMDPLVTTSSTGLVEANYKVTVDLSISEDGVWDVFIHITPSKYAVVANSQIDGDISSEITTTTNNLGVLTATWETLEESEGNITLTHNFQVTHNGLSASTSIITDMSWVAGIVEEITFTWTPSEIGTTYGFLSNSYVGVDSLYHTGTISPVEMYRVYADTVMGEDTSDADWGLPIVVDAMDKYFLQQMYPIEWNGQIIIDTIESTLTNPPSGGVVIGAEAHAITSWERYSSFERILPDGRTYYSWLITLDKGNDFAGDYYGMLQIIKPAINLTVTSNTRGDITDITPTTKGGTIDGLISSFEASTDGTGTQYFTLYTVATKTDSSTVTDYQSFKYTLTDIGGLPPPE